MGHCLSNAVSNVSLAVTSAPGCGTCRLNTNTVMATANTPSQNATRRPVSPSSFSSLLLSLLIILPTLHYGLTSPSPALVPSVVAISASTIMLETKIYALMEDARGKKCIARSCLGFQNPALL